MLALPALFVAACAAPGVNAPAATGGTAAPSFTERMNSMLFGAPAQQVAATGPAQPEPPDCPPITVRQGAATLVTYGRGDEVATNVRYQVSIGQLARECAMLGPTVTAKLGMQGRVVLGPAGGAGRITVPVRFALVREGPQPRTVWTQLYNVPVDVPSGQSNVAFVHVDESVSFATPSEEDAGAMIFYVGFDQLASREPRGRRR